MIDAFTETGLCPGDLVEWVSTCEEYAVARNELLWSSTEQRYAHIGSKTVHVVVAVFDNVIAWVNPLGLFQAAVDDWANRKGVHHFPVRPKALRYVLE